MFLKIIKVSINDFLTPKFLFLATAPLLFSGFIMLVLIIFGGIEIFNFFEDINNVQNMQDDTFLNTIMQLAIIKWIVSGLFISIGTFILPIISVVIALIITGFLTPTVVKEINKRHYNIIIKPEVSTAKTLWLSITIFLKFILIFIVCLPLIAIPILGTIPINISLFYLYYKLLLVDVGSSCLDSNEFKLFIKNSTDKSFILPCVCFYVLCLIPFIALFFQLLFVIYLTHLMFLKKLDQA